MHRKVQLITFSIALFPSLVNNKIQLFFISRNFIVLTDNYSCPGGVEDDIINMYRLPRKGMEKLWN